MIASIFLTAQDSASSETTELLRKAAGEKAIFSLIETIPGPNFIYLDNYAVGQMAARTLIEAGCRNIAGICFDYNLFNNLIFARRMAGFRDTLKTNDLFEPGRIGLIPYPSNGRFNPFVGDQYNKAAREALDGLFDRGCDGVFVASDEEIGLISMNLFRQGLIPERIKLLSVNGVGDAMRHDPPVACLSHGTRKVVDAAIEQLKLIAEKRFAGPVEIVVHPKLYENFTLNRISHVALESKPISAVVG